MKAPEASTSQEDKPITEGVKPSESVVRSEEPSAETKDSSSEEKIDGAAPQARTEIRSPEDIEKLFSPAAQERLLGLLGAILPQDSKVIYFHMEKVDEILELIFVILEKKTRSVQQTLVFKKKN